MIPDLYSVHTKNFEKIKNEACCKQITCKERDIGRGPKPPPRLSVSTVSLVSTLGLKRLSQPHKPLQNTEFDPMKTKNESILTVTETSSPVHSDAFSAPRLAGTSGAHSLAKAKKHDTVSLQFAHVCIYKSSLSSFKPFLTYMITVYGVTSN